MERKSFIIYIEMDEYLSKLTDEQCGRVTKAMFAYAKGEEVDLGGDVAAEIVFSVFKNRFDADDEKYIDKIDKRRKAGIASGKARQVNRTERTHVQCVQNTDSAKGSDVETINTSEQNEHMLNVFDCVEQKGTKRTDTDTDTDTVTDTVTVTDTDITCKEIDSIYINNNDDDDNTDNFKRLVNAYEGNIGPLSSVVVRSLKNLLETHPPDLVIHAIEEAARSGANSIRYIEGIFNNWDRYGIKDVSGAKAHELERTRKMRASPNQGMPKSVQNSSFRNYPESYDISDAEKKMIDEQMKKYKEAGHDEQGDINRQTDKGH